MDLEQLIGDSRPFLNWLVDWHNTRPTLNLVDLLDGEVNAPDHIAVLAVDVTSGFCSEGPLSSPRVGRIVQPIARLFQRAHDLGVRQFVLPQDTHTENAIEFESYPAHCVRGTEEPVTVPELSALPFSDQFRIVEKNSISSSINTELDDWLDGHPQVSTFLVVGDCTDLCVHQLAMRLRLRANARNLGGVRVILPLEGVDTFDLPVDVASEIGAMPHHGDLLHLVFLYNMAQNGIEIVAKVV